MEVFEVKKHTRVSFYMNTDNGNNSEMLKYQKWNDRNTSYADNINNTDNVDFTNDSIMPTVNVLLGERSKYNTGEEAFHIRKIYLMEKSSEQNLNHILRSNF